MGRRMGTVAEPGVRQPAPYLDGGQLARVGAGGEGGPQQRDGGVEVRRRVDAVQLQPHD